LTNKNIFCNTPWYELQIYWDGSLGFCCQEDHQLYPEEAKEKYNITNMSIQDWYDSKPMRAARSMMFADTRNSVCRRCYHEEDHSDSSRRHRSNQKSVIFTRTNFQESYEQSPGFDKFEKSRINHGAYDSLPLELHIDLGNYCNLSCKMCNPKASSNIAAQHVKWGIKGANKFVGTDWTRDQAVWDRVLDELASIPNFKNIHFMGGETLITRRFEDFIDYMIDRRRFDLNFSFVTNGTTFNESLLDKLKKFQRVGIEVSIETVTDHNAYQRQGTDTQQVLANIQRYITHCNGSNITLTVRPAISLLTIGHYHTLLRYCHEHRIIVKALLVSTPKFLDVKVLPDTVRQDYSKHYKQLIEDLNLYAVDAGVDYNESDPNQIDRIIKNQIDQCLTLLTAPQAADADQLLDKLVLHCRRWDDVHGYNAVELYPELAQEFVTRGY
jgi:sulfatase maturation enzyme AslB (radical SAM superfamily)